MILYNYEDISQKLSNLMINAIKNPITVTDEVEPSFSHVSDIHNLVKHCPLGNYNIIELCMDPIIHKVRIQPGPFTYMVRRRKIYLLTYPMSLQIVHRTFSTNLSLAGDERSMLRGTSIVAVALH